MNKLLLPVLLVVSAALITPQGFAQNVPADLEIIAMSGSRELGSENATIRITADGAGRYTRYRPDRPGTSPLQSVPFELSAAELEQLWETIQGLGFFGLEASYGPPIPGRRDFARVIIRADGDVHAVTIEGVAVEPFDDVVDAINALTPEGNDLIYDMRPVPEYVPVDVCDLPGKQEDFTEVLGKKYGEGEPIEKAGQSTNGGAAHPGTVVACSIPLDDAVDVGIVDLEGKGGYFGDSVSITANNTGFMTCDRITVRLYLEFWGSHATDENAAKAVASILNAWDGHQTSDGKTLDVEVDTRVSTGSDAPPGTPGYHQIEMTGDGYFDADGEVNEGTGSGSWNATHPHADDLYAHEAGHLMGLPDQYDDFFKDDDGNWVRKADEQVFTSEELAEKLLPIHPDKTKEELEAWLDDPAHERVTIPRPGHEDDLMGNLDGSVQQSDVDAIGAQTGLLIEVRPGDVLVNKNGIAQSLAITRSIDLFVPAGGSKRIDGLYTACIDAFLAAPSQGNVFDVAPRLNAWTGIEAAAVLLQLLEYVDREELFCPFASSTQNAIWHVTDNMEPSQSASALLLAAGVEVGDRVLDFPRLRNPNAADPESGVVLPPQLVIAEITPTSSRLLDGPQTVYVSGTASIPAGVDASTTLSWELAAPPESEATISDDGSAASFTADVPGLYLVRLHALVTRDDVELATWGTSTLFSLPDDRTETFESGRLATGAPFFWRSSGDQPWTVTETSVNTGRFSAVSGEIGDGESSTVEAHFSIESPGFFAHAYRVSSEPRSDVLRFSVNEQVIGEASGEQPWRAFGMFLQPGEYVARWEYAKDGSASVGSDRAWLDDVFFPAHAVFHVSAEGPEHVGLPERFHLAQNFPNPFNPSTTITYDLPAARHVRLVVYDALGRQVAVLADDQVPAGVHRVRFDAGELAGGVYFYRLTAGDFTESRRMVLLK